MKINFLIVLLLCFFDLIPGAYKTKAPSDYTDQDFWEESEDCLKQLNVEIDWYIASRLRSTKNREKSLKERNLWQDVLEDDQKLIISLQKAQKAFHDLKTNLTEAILAESYYSHDGKSYSISAGAEMIKWYTRLIHDYLFPSEWQKYYESDSQDQLYLQVSPKTHRIQPGDTLFKIAREHFGDPGKAHEIALFNKIQEEKNLHPGDALKLPYKVYQVHDEETLIEIAQMFFGGDSKSIQIAKLNGLSSPYKLKSGQIIFLPMARVILDPED